MKIAEIIENDLGFPHSDALTDVIKTRNQLSSYLQSENRALC